MITRVHDVMRVRRVVPRLSRLQRERTGDGSILAPLQCGAMDGIHLHNGISHLPVSLMSDVLVVGLLRDLMQKVKKSDTERNVGPR